MSSLRYKFLFFLSGTVLLTITAFLVMTVYVFKSDKASYVFDTILSQTKNLSRSFRAETESYLTLTKTLAHSTNLQSRDLSSIGEFVFSQRPDAVHFEVWALNQTTGEGETLVQKTKTQDAPVLDSFKKSLVEKTEHEKARHNQNKVACQTRSSGVILGQSLSRQQH